VALYPLDLCGSSLEGEEGANDVVDVDGLGLSWSRARVLGSSYGAGGVGVDDHVAVGAELEPVYHCLDGADFSVEGGLFGSKGP